MASCWSCTGDWYPFINVSAFLPPFCICHNLSVSEGTTSVGDRTILKSSVVVLYHLPTAGGKEERLKPPPRMICPRYTTTQTSWLRSPCSTCSQRLFFFNCFEPRVDNQWHLSNLSWIEICFCVVVFLFFFITLIFLFKWIPMDCVTVWFMQLCWNEKRLRL